MRADDRAWKRIERHEDAIVYVPPDDSDRSLRIEYVLASGRTIVDDRDAGLAIRIEIRERLDWETWRASGAILDEGEVKTRSAVGDCFVVLRYQDFVDADGFVTRSVLRSVEGYEGSAIARQEEPDIEVRPPQHLTGTSILVPEPRGE